MRRTRNFISGLLLGAFVGSVVALLFAPSSGEATRMRIQDHFENAKNEINAAAEQKRSELESELAKLRNIKLE
ncbi:MAG: YtxH domain-containing protein [Anaerolineaceae bacterium]|jgi:gas vesicle protein